MWEEYKHRTVLNHSLCITLLLLSKPEAPEEEVTFGARDRYGKRAVQQKLSDGYCWVST